MNLKLDMVFCQPCDKGFYKDYTEDEACTPCPDGCMTEYAGSDKASDCMYSSHSQLKAIFVLYLVLTLFMETIYHHF